MTYGSLKLNITYRYVLIIIFLIILIPLTLNSQNLSLDSLRYVIKTADHDSSKFDTQLVLIKHFRYHQPDTALYYCHQALHLARLRKMQKRESLVLNQLGILAKNKNNFKEAISYYNKALEIVQGLENFKRQAAILNNLGNVYHRWNKLDSALICYQQSLDMKVVLGHEPAIAKAYNNLGNFFASCEENETSKMYYLKTLALEEKNGTGFDLARTHLNLGNTYFKTNQLDSAQYFYELSCTFHQKNNNLNELALGLHNLASIAELNKELDQSLRLYNRSLDIQKKQGSNPLRMVNTLNNMGNIYVSKEDFQKAIVLYNEALVYTDKGDLVDRKRLLNLQLSQCYEKINKFDLALSYYKNFKVFNDTIYNARRDQALFEINTKYETEKQSKEILIQRAANEEKTRKLSMMIITLFFLLLLLSLGLLAYNRKRKDNKILSKQKEVITKKEQEKALLLRELHHRVKNNLQLISSLLNIQAHQLKNTEAVQAIKESQSRVEAMALIHRDLYQKENLTQINLPFFITKLLENLTLSYPINKLQIHQEVEELEIGADLAIPLGLILNEIITNALKYAFSLAVDTPRIRVTAKKLLSQQLYIKIKDNGSGFSIRESSKNTFGKELIASLSRQIDARMNTSIEDGYEYELWIPLHLDTFKQKQFRA